MGGKSENESRNTTGQSNTYECFFLLKHTIHYTYTCKIKQKNLSISVTKTYKFLKFYEHVATINRHFKWILEEPLGRSTYFLIRSHNSFVNVVIIKYFFCLFELPFFLNL